MKTSVVKNALVGLVALASSGLAAQSHAEGNWYVGGSVSQAFVDERGLDEDDTGAKIFGGYKFNDYVAIEGGYYDFGEIGNSSSELEIDGISLAVVGSVPVSSKISLLGKVGVHDWDADVTGSASSAVNTDSDTDAFYGIGAEYALTDSLKIRAELERYEVEDLDVDLVSVGISFSF
jgi:OOP family OmpA-OmpF porin